MATGLLNGPCLPSVHLRPPAQGLLNLACSQISRGAYLEYRCPGPIPDLLNQNSGGQIEALAIFTHTHTLPNLPQPLTLQDSEVESTSLSHELLGLPLGFSYYRQLQNKVRSQWNIVVLKNISGEYSILHPLLNSRP